MTYPVVARPNPADRPRFGFSHPGYPL